MNRVSISLFLLCSSLSADIFPFQIIEKANSAYAHKDFKKAIKLFKCLDSKNRWVAYNLGNSYYKIGMYNKALEYYTLAKGVDEPIRLYNIGNSYFKKGDFIRAVTFYRASLALKEDEDTKQNLHLAEESIPKKIFTNKFITRDRYHNFTEKKASTLLKSDRDRKEEIASLLEKIEREVHITKLYKP